MKKLKIISAIVTGLMGLLSYAHALAQGAGLVYPPAIPTLPGGSTPGANTVSIWAVDIINYALALAGIVAVAFLIFGGFRYITSGGNDEAAESGKKIITNSIIGLIIIILSYVIVTVIINALLYRRA